MIVIPTLLKYNSDLPAIKLMHNDVVSDDSDDFDEG